MTGAKKYLFPGIILFLMYVFQYVIIGITAAPLPILNRKIFLFQIFPQPKRRKPSNVFIISRSVSILFERTSQTYRKDSNIFVVSIAVFWIY
jgi:hypothetical protein